MRTIKFIASDDVRITSQVDGYGAGFPHVGLKTVADSMGWSTPQAKSFGTTNIVSNTLKAWNGSPAVIGWLVDVETYDK